MNNYKNWPKPITSQRHLSRYRYKKISATMKVFTKSILHGNAARQLRCLLQICASILSDYNDGKISEIGQQKPKMSKKIKVTVFLVDGVLSK